MNNIMFYILTIGKMNRDLVIRCCFIILIFTSCSKNKSIPVAAETKEVNSRIAETNETAETTETALKEISKAISGEASIEEPIVVVQKSSRTRDLRTDTKPSVSSSLENRPVSPLPEVRTETRTEIHTEAVRTESFSPREKRPQDTYPDDSRGLEVFVGMGMNYVRYENSLSDVKAGYGDLRGPSYHLGAFMELSDAIDIEATYKTTPFRFDNSLISASSLNGEWQTLAVGGAWYPEALRESRLGWLYGLQIHQIPLALFEDVTNAPVLRSIQTVNLTVGARWKSFLNPWTCLSVQFRGQYPILSSSSSAKSDFTGSSYLIFDGSIGADKRIGKKIWLGLHWFGQYHRFQFSYRDPNVTAEGIHSAVYSNLELRLGFEF